MLKRFFLLGLLTISLLFIPVSQAFAEATGDNASSLMNGPFVILAFSTIIVLIYHCIRD